MSAQPSLDPTSGYYLIRAGRLSDLDGQVLTKLYQPLINPNAFTLYQALWASVDDALIRSQRPHHFQILELLGINPQEFLHARQQLEAVGLIRSFQTTDELGDYLIYYLYPPLTPERFFHEEILATYLLEKVSRKRYLALVQEFQLPRFDLQKAQEVTAGFLDVFNLPSSTLLTPPTEVKSGAQRFQSDQPQQLVSEVSPAQLATFDWETLLALVGQKQIRKSEIMAHQSEIYGLHEFYQFSITDIARLISRSLDLKNNQIDFRSLEQQALTLYDQLNSDERSKPAVAKPATPAPVKTSASEAFSSDDQALLQMAKSMGVLPFATKIKKQKNPRLYVGKGEMYNLKTLQQRHAFSEGTLNILVWAVLQENPTLTVAHLDSIAQDWLTAKITTPEAGLSYYYQRQKGVSSANRRPRRQSKNQGVIPSWLQPEQTNTSAPSSSEQKQNDPQIDDEIQRNLAWLKQQRQQRGDDHV
ncbi:hypothetical protein [Lapidilactobacillus luobeiensis]|uniref:hypothetical protein n=1 Tax=Lapidilactobacillus luobeiensis TaxID=2950371 RepID=UPI0021C4714F|nr:hypothetical protein [Lapidilactobacillus luobeiensis]